jgi:hypothetical protein
MTDDNIVHMPTPMNVLADKIRKGHKRLLHGRSEWIEGMVEQARALAEARARFPSNQAFGVWLAENDLDHFGADNRAAMVNLAEACFDDRDLHFVFDQYADQQFSPDTIWRIVKEKRWAYVKSRFEEELTKRLPSSDGPKTTPLSHPTPETAPIEPSEPAKVEMVEPEKQPDNRLSSPPEVPKSLLTQSPFVKRNYPQAELVLGYLLSADTRSKLANILPMKRPGLLWDLIIESIESGAFGPPSDFQVNQPNMRMLLPWLPNRVVRRLHLDVNRSADLETFRADVLPIVLANRELLVEQPDKLVTMVYNSRAARENAARQQRQETKAAAALAKMPSTEKPVLAFGSQLWPRVNDDHAFTFTYDELCHAVWFCQYLLSNLPADWDPTSKAMQSRHLIKYVAPMLKGAGWGRAVRQFLSAFEQNPNGESRIPPPPINFGM